MSGGRKTSETHRMTPRKPGKRNLKLFALQSFGRWPNSRRLLLCHSLFSHYSNDASRGLRRPSTMRAMFFLRREGSFVTVFSDPPQPRPRFNGLQVNARSGKKGYLFAEDILHWTLTQICLTQWDYRTPELGDKEGRFRYTLCKSRCRAPDGFS